MNDTLRPLTPKPDRPVEPLALLVIREIHKAASELGFPAFLVGAMARIILLENIYGLKAGRATTDVDFAFALDNWDQFRTIKTFLVANAKFVESKHVIGTKRSRLIEDMARAMLGREDALKYSHRLLVQFTNGFTA